MTGYDYDLFVIGGGSGGVRAARIAAGHGARVAIAEEDRYGGTCVIRGCVPKKLLVYATDIGSAIANADSYGWTTGETAFDWETLIDNVSAEVERLSRIYVRLLDEAGATVLHDRAVLADAHTIAVGGERVTAAAILIATGSRPDLPRIPGVEHALTSDDMFRLRALPRHVTVVGGGYIALEFAGVLSGLGSDVRLIHRRSHVLRGFDDEVREMLTRALQRGPIETRMDTEIVAVERTKAGSLALILTSGEVVETDALLCATGRHPNTANLGLEAAGVTLGENGAVVVDAYSRSSVPHIYAVGDATDRVNLTPVAIREGHAVADTLFGARPTPIRHTNIPTAVFSQPPVAAIGLTEAEARRTLGTVDIYRANFRPLFYSLTRKRERMFMKLIVDAASERVVGAHIVGKDGPEIVQAIAVAITAGATKPDFDATFALHPTSAEEIVLMRTKSE